MEYGGSYKQIFTHCGSWLSGLLEFNLDRDIRRFNNRFPVRFVVRCGGVMPCRVSRGGPPSCLAKGLAMSTAPWSIPVRSSTTFSQHFYFPDVSCNASLAFWNNLFIFYLSCIRLWAFWNFFFTSSMYNVFPDVDFVSSRSKKNMAKSSWRLFCFRRM